jgi:hypothetical protein
MCVSACACVSVRVWERERERRPIEQERGIETLDDDKSIKDKHGPIQ